jgi:hypothetical protein
MKYIINKKALYVAKDVREKNEREKNNREKLNNAQTREMTKPSIMIINYNVNIFCLQQPNREYLNFVQEMLN